MAIYRDTLRVPEYFLFDPWDEYLDPPLQGHRLVDGKYERIEPVDGRLPSKILGLHLEADGPQLRLYDPLSKQWLRTPPEEHEARQKAEVDRQRAEADRQKAEAENERLRREVEELRRRLSGQS
jgi:hypothetical protein